MRQFNAPPEWPEPPNARWRPPKTWQPDDSWPPAPDGWVFWIDEHGRPVRGPIGRYGGPSLLKLGAAAAVLLVLIGLVLFNPFTGGDPDQASGPPPTQATETTAAPPSTTESPTAEQTPTGTPTPNPTPVGSTIPPTSTSPVSPTPSASRTPEPTVTPIDTPTVVTYKNCAQVRAAGKAPLHSGDPGYSRDLDKNGDGVACERGNS